MGKQFMSQFDQFGCVWVFSTIRGLARIHTRSKQNYESDSNNILTLGHRATLVQYATGIIVILDCY